MGESGKYFRETERYEKKIEKMLENEDDEELESPE